MRKYLTSDNLLHGLWALCSGALIYFATTTFNKVLAAEQNSARHEVMIVDQEKQSERQFKLLQEQLDRRFNEIDKRLEKIEQKL